MRFTRPGVNRILTFGYRKCCSLALYLDYSVHPQLGEAPIGRRAVIIHGQLSIDGAGYGRPVSRVRQKKGLDAWTKNPDWRPRSPLEHIVDRDRVCIQECAVAHVTICVT